MWAFCFDFVFPKMKRVEKKNKPRINKRERESRSCLHPKDRTLKIQCRPGQEMLYFDRQ